MDMVSLIVVLILVLAALILGSFSNYLENELLDHVVGKGSYTMPTAYVALCTADPTDAGTGAAMSEVPNAGAYARVSTAGADWNLAAAGSISNVNDVTFPEASGSWGTVTHFAIVDSGTYGAGNMLAHGTLGASKAINSGDTAKFTGGSPGDIVITLD